MCKEQLNVHKFKKIFSKDLELVNTSTKYKKKIRLNLIYISFDRDRTIGLRVVGSATWLSILVGKMNPPVHN